jgi:hypothetical protein
MLGGGKGFSGRVSLSPSKMGHPAATIMDGGLRMVGLNVLCGL